MLYISYALGLLAAALLGYFVNIEDYIARIFIRGKRSVQRRLTHRRDEEMRPPTSNDIAQMLDILVLSLSAGLSFDYAVAMYSEQFNNRLAHDLGNALFSWQIGACSRVDALTKLSDSYNNYAFERFVQCVAESIELGSPIAQTLESHAEMIRQSQRSELETKIEKLPVKILIPLTTLILPAMLIAILGPIFAGVFK